MIDKFKELGISDAILQTIQEMGFTAPTDVQSQAIPLALDGKDVIAGSATGSGKTLAFAAGIIQKTERGKGIQALVMTPTRELAEQIKKEFEKFSKHDPINIALIFGGVSITPQMEALTMSEVVVGTPGRILDHISRRTMDLSKVKTLVLDEADRMLDMGFIDDVKQIISQCPKQRQTLLFSATIPLDIERLIERIMNQPIKVSVDSMVDPTMLHQVYYDVDDKVKFALLVHLLKSEKTGLAMIFCNTKSNTDFVVNNLKALGFKALALHGGFTQDKRSKTMDQFHNQDFELLVCTDVAARGLDIKGVTHVYNYDIPKESKQYIHRIGRTARAGENGLAINLLTQRDHDNFSRVLRDYDVLVKKMQMPQVERVRIAWKGFSSDFSQEEGRLPMRGRGGPRHGGPRGHHSGGPRRDNRQRRD